MKYLLCEFGRPCRKCHPGFSWVPVSLVNPGVEHPPSLIPTVCPFLPHLDFHQTKACLHTSRHHEQICFLTAEFAELFKVIERYNCFENKFRTYVTEPKFVKKCTPVTSLVMGHSRFTITHLTAAVSRGLRASPVATWWFQEMGKCEQTSVCLSKPGPCVPGVHLSCWARWRKPAGIKELGFLAGSHLQRSLSSEWERSIIHRLRDIGRAHGEQWRLPRGATWSALASPHASAAGQQKREHLGSRSRSLRTWTIYKQAFCHLWIPKPPWNKTYVRLSLSLLWLWSYVACASIERRVDRLTFSPSACLPTRKTHAFVCTAFILIRACGQCEMHIHFNLI